MFIKVMDFTQGFPIFSPKSFNPAPLYKAIVGNQKIVVCSEPFLHTDNFLSSKKLHTENSIIKPFFTKQP